MTVRMGKTGWFLTLLTALGITAFALWRWNVPAPPLANLEVGKETPAEAPSRVEMTDEAEALERLRKLPASLRKDLIDEIAAKETYCAVDKVPNSIRVSGTIQSKTMSELVCLVRPETPNAAAAGVRWVVPDRTRVKMGDRLIELDDEPLKQRRTSQIALIAEAENALKLASAKSRNVQNDQSVQVQLAQAELKFAVLDRNRFAGNDPQQMKKLADAVSRAGQALEQAKGTASTEVSKAAEEQQAKKNMLDRVRAHRQLLDEDLATCVLYAPRDGQVVHAVLPLQPGVQFKEGQKILWVCDLADLKMTARIDEAREPGIALVRPGQLAYVRVINRPVPHCKVSQVIRPARGIVDVEIELFKKEIPEEVGSVVPDTAATALIVIDEVPKCLLVPATAVLGQGQEKYCYVLKDRELLERPVATGPTRDANVEITQGLTEGEQVLSDPLAVVGRLAKVLRAKK